MRRLALIAVFALAACGGGAVPSHAPTARAALTEAPEALELESRAVRQTLYTEIAQRSLSEAGQQASQLVLFPIVQDGQAIAAPGFDPKTDLLQAVGGAEADLVLSDGSDRWPSERRFGLQGLSEREAAELVARSLVGLWNLHPHGTVSVERATGAPYAAAWVDGILRINPSFLYLVCAAGPQADEPLSKR